jgi:hypothetical protein
VGCEREVGEELGALGPDMREGGRFSARNRESSPEGSIPVVSVKEHMRRVVGPCGLRERGRAKSWGPWSPICVKGAGLAHETENRALRARYRWYL